MKFPTLRTTARYDPWRSAPQIKQEKEFPSPEIKARLGPRHQMPSTQYRAVALAALLSSYADHGFSHPLFPDYQTVNDIIVNLGKTDRYLTSEDAGRLTAEYHYLQREIVDFDPEAFYYSPDQCEEVFEKAKRIFILRLLVLDLYGEYDKGHVAFAFLIGQYLSYLEGFL